MSSPPILIAGVPRSGNTWMQFALSQHPRIHIHGHLAAILPGELEAWLGTLTASGEKAMEWNAELSYPVPHFAGSGPARCRKLFAQMLKDFITGYGSSSPRWGFKSLWDTSGLYRRLWPKAQWIICARHPRRSYESMLNTQNVAAPVEDFLRNWVASVQFGLYAPNACIWQIDAAAQASVEQRGYAMHRLLNWLNEEDDKPTLQFATRLPVIHKLISNGERQKHLNDRSWNQLLKQTPNLKQLISKLPASTSLILNH